MKTDAQIQKDVMDELQWEPSLNATEIGVAVNNGIVTLSGTVNTYSKKTAAEKAAQRVAGVKAVAEDIEVKLPSSFVKNDTEIAESIVQTLKWNLLVQKEKIKINVDNGWVTLEGEVGWEFQKTSIRNSVENAVGVRGITNLLHVAPRVSMKDVKEKISAAFERHANIDAGRITIDTLGNKVVLTGKVRSLAEKRDAEYAAWAAPGVSQVENKLQVAYGEALAAM